MKPSIYPPVRHLNMSALDVAWLRYHRGGIQHGQARDDMVAAGVSRPEAERLLSGCSIPSLTRRPPWAAGQ